MRVKNLSIIHLVIVLCLFVFAFAVHSTAGQKDGLLHIYFFNVGQGESELIETPNGKKILIDGGPDGTILSKLGKMMPFYDRNIDFVIATHPGSEYVGGLTEVLNRYDVSHVIEMNGLYDTSQLIAWHDAVMAEHADEIEALSGKEIDLGDGSKIIIIYPDRSFNEVALSKAKEANMIIMFKYQSFRLLLTGGIDGPLESYLVNGGVNLKADVLKISHDKYKKSDTEKFIKTVDPETVIVESVLPDPDTLSSLESFGIKYYRTDTKGDITLTGDGGIYQIKTEK